jgi:hypothetical protein
MQASLELNVRLAGFSRIDYDKRPIRKQLRLQGNLLRDAARALVSRKGRSKAGEYPGRQTGLLRRSIGTRVLRGGLAVLVEPRRKVLQTKRSYRDAAYPFILAAGTDHMQPRDDYVSEALKRRSDVATSALRATLESALVPR